MTKRLKPGDPLRIPARDWNAAMDLVDAQQRARDRRALILPDTEIVLAVPQGFNCVSGAIVSIGSVVNTGDLGRWSKVRVYQANQVQWPRDAYGFALATEPVDAGEVGRFAVGGLVPCTGVLPGSYATLKPDLSTLLLTGGSGYPVYAGSSAGDAGDAYQILDMRTPSFLWHAGIDSPGTDPGVTTNAFLADLDDTVVQSSWTGYDDPIGMLPTSLTGDAANPPLGRTALALWAGGRFTIIAASCPE